MFRRGFRRNAMKGGMQPNVPPLLRKAHELMASGNYEAAAEAFEQVAQKAQARNHPRAPQLFLQAGRAYILAGQKPKGFGLVKNALELLKNNPVRLFRLGNVVVRELDEHGMKAESQEIAAWLKTIPPAGGGTAKMSALEPTKKPVLPVRCPNCGAAVRADEVDWVDNSTAECTYCGSPLRAEE